MEEHEVSFVLVTIYQGLVIFEIQHTKVFLIYSAFFLNFNVACVAFLFFFDKFSNTKDILNILTEFFTREGEELDPERDTDLNEEIDSQADNP